MILIKYSFGHKVAGHIEHNMLNDHKSSHICVILMSINIDMVLFDIQHG